MRETWYVLEDGTAVDPKDVAPDKSGALKHKNGMVAMRGDVPSTRSVDPEEEQSKSKKTRDMQPEEPKRGYKTR